ILECPEAVAGIKNGDEVEIDLDNGTIYNITTGESFKAKPFPPFMQNLIEVGGLINYTKKKLEDRK
ncbi:MAG: 3-isopropylmalate dehydratase small subunit, partial [Armatimonadota bacterium]